MKVRDEKGFQLDATFTVEYSEGALTVIFESRSGTKNGPTARNAHYEIGLELVLKRLAQLNFLLLDAVVDSHQTRRMGLDREQRRLHLRNTQPYPIPLGNRTDTAALRLAICAAQRSVATRSRKGGNNTKQIRLYVADPIGSVNRPSDLARLLESGMDSTEALPTPEEKEAPAQRRNAFARSAAYRQAVERHAMDVVVAHFRLAGWEVTDTSATHPFDLRCNKNEKAVLVEVKGTAGAGQSVILTRNEVAQARNPNVPYVLAVVSAIIVTEDATGFAASGGNLRKYDPVDLTVGALIPISFEYILPV